jgi:hypothetical protein
MNVWKHSKESNLKRSVQWDPAARLTFTITLTWFARLLISMILKYAPTAALVDVQARFTGL